MWVSRGVFICVSRLSYWCVGVCVCAREGSASLDYKEEVNGKYTLSDKIRGRHIPLLPPPPLLPLSPLSLGSGRALGKSNRWFVPGRKAGWARGGQAYRLLGAIKSS